MSETPNQVSVAAREAAARAMEGDCENPLRVREANAIREGLRDFDILARSTKARAAVGVEAVRDALEPVWHWYQSDEHTERPLAEIVADVVADLQQDRAFVLNPPKHRYWMPGELDCPREIKAGNGELHTLRCKVCNQDNPRDEICRLATPAASSTGADRLQTLSTMGMI